MTYVSVDGAFGGPLTVAMGQAKELAKRGHDVDLIAAWDGVGQLSVPGVSIRLFKSQRVAPAGFSGLISPGLLKFLREDASAYDVVHVHMSRDLITLPAARRALRQLKKVVIQTHGMVMPDMRIKARLFDAVITRSVLHKANVVLSLTELEARGISSVSRGTAKVARIANGIEPIAPLSPRSARADGSADVLFLARLHSRKRVLAFAEMARQLCDLNPQTQFRVVGPDEGDLEEFERFVADHSLGDRISYEGALPPGAAPSRLRSASVYVLPSVGEVFPMTVLEALAAGTPVVLTDDCGIAPELTRRRAAIVTDGSPEALADAVARILAEPGLASELVDNGLKAVDEYFSIRAVVDQLEGFYEAD